MKREIKFRGLRVDGKGLVYGDYYTGLNDLIYIRHVVSIVNETGRQSQAIESIVNPESVGQFTGLQDKNGVDIYFDDKLFWSGQGIGFVKMGESGKAYARGEECYIDYSSFKKCEIIGNIHQP